MGSTETTFEERLLLADAIDDLKGFFSKPHCKRLVDEALQGARAGSKNLEFVIAVARRCKTGLVSVEQLAEQVERMYSLNHMPPQQKGEGGGGDGEHHDDVGQEEEEVEEEEKEEEEDQEEEEDGGDEEENEVPGVDRTVKKLFETHRRGFCSKGRWPSGSKIFRCPGEGYWLDAHRIQLFRASTYKDFATATPKPTPVYIDGNQWCGKAPKRKFVQQEKNYHLCKSVAVSFDGKIYRATDAEIEAALGKKEGAPEIDAATYVKLAQETRRCHAVERTFKRGSCQNADKSKRRRVRVAT